MPSNILETPKSKPTSAPRPKGNAGNERKAAAPNPTSARLKEKILLRPLDAREILEMIRTLDARTHARTHARRTITTTTAPSKEDEHVRNVNEKYQNMPPQIASTTRWINRRKRVRDDKVEKQKRAKTLEIHRKIVISTTRKRRRTTPRRRRQNPEVWRGSKNDHFPFIIVSN